MITTIFMPFSYTFSCYLSVSFLRKTSWIFSFIHSLSLKSSSYSFLPPPLPYLSSKCYWETSLCWGAASLHLMQDFSLSQLRKYTGGCIHFARKKIFRNRGEYMPEELCYLWLCSWTWPQKSRVSRAQAVTGGKWPATSQGEPQVPVSNEGIHTAMGSDTTVVYHVLVLPIACPSHIHFPSFTCSVSRCHHAAQSPLTQPKQPTAWHFL